MSDPSASPPGAPALTKEQEAAMATAPPPEVGQPHAQLQPPPYAPPDAGYAVQPGAMQVAYVPGSAQPAVYMPGSAQPVAIVPQQMVMVEPEQFITDYRGFAWCSTMIFAVLGPLSLACGVPAVWLAFKSRKALKEGNLKDAKKWSVSAAYLSVGTIVLGFICMMLIILLPTGFRFQINGG